MKTFCSTGGEVPKIGWRRVAVAAVLMSLVAAACGGTEAARDDAVAAAGTAGSDSSAPASNGVTNAGLFTPWTISTTASLVEQLGSEDTALDALFLSINNGYSTPQIRQALEDTALQADGSIAGVDPSMEPLNMILQPGQDGEGEGALGSDDAPQSLAFVQRAPLPIETFRKAARAAGAASASEDEVGALGLRTVVQLVEDGFAVGDIIEIILFGAKQASGPYSLPGSCNVRAFWVVNEWICPRGERYNEDLAEAGQTIDPEAEGEPAIRKAEGSVDEVNGGDDVGVEEVADAAPEEPLVSERLGTGTYLGDIDFPSADPDRELISANVELSGGEEGLSLSIEQIYTLYLPFETCTFKTHRVSWESSEVTRDTVNDLWFEGTFRFETIDAACGEPSGLEPRDTSIRFQLVGNELVASPGGLEDIRIALD